MTFRAASLSVLATLSLSVAACGGESSLGDGGARAPWERTPTTATPAPPPTPAIPPSPKSRSRRSPWSARCGGLSARASSSKIAAATPSELTIFGALENYTATADEHGDYSIVLPVDESLVHVIVTAPGHLSTQATQVELEAGEIVSLDFELLLTAPCAALEPDAIVATVDEGAETVERVHTENRGSIDLEWTLDFIDETRALAFDCDSAQGLVIHDDGTSACHGDATLGHKMFLFSELDDGSSDVVVQSSANLTRSQTVANNSLVVVRDDAALYAAFLTNWDDMARQVAEPDYYWVAEGDSQTRAHFFPRGSADGVTGEGDTVWEIFDAIDCADGSVLYIGQARFRWNRRGLAHKLVQMSSEGCEIHAVLEPGRTDERIAEMLTDAGISVTFFPRIHSKYFLLDGTFEGHDCQWVWTGSQNFSGAGLVGNDNVILKLANKALYDAFLADWTILQGHPDAYDPAAR